MNGAKKISILILFLKLEKNKSNLGEILKMFMKFLTSKKSSLIA